MKDTATTTHSGEGGARRPIPAAEDICVIVNAGSGKRDGGGRRQALEAQFARYPGRFALRLVRRGDAIEAAARQAVDDGFDTVVAAGGDGTIAAVTAALAGTPCRMGVLPLGTFNYFARSLDLPQELEAAVRVVAEGRVRKIDVGDVNGRVFLNNASIGAYPAILRQREEIYRRWGRSRLAAYWSVLVTLLGFKATLDLTATVDGEVHRFRTPLAFVAKNAHQLQEIGLEGGDCVRSGQLALFIAEDAGRLTLVYHAARLALGLSEPERDFELLCGNDVVVDLPSPGTVVARDGERGYLDVPLRFRLRREALAVLVPGDW